MKSKIHKLAFASAFLSLALSLPASALAAENGPTVTGQVCMQKTFGTPVTSANKLNCTANDIRLSRAISVSPQSCIKGTTFDLTATFETVVTANSRYDAGFFFRIDGGANARGDGASASGACSLSALKPPPPENAPALDLDHDTCGDLNSGTYQVTFVIPGVVCEAAPGTNQLRLPNCTSWHSNASTACQVSDPFAASDAFGFHPDTKSKCVCDDTFTVPVRVEDATISVVKSAAPTQVYESGGEVVYTVQITNDAQVEPVTITSIVDDVVGDVGTNAPNLQDNTCPTIIGTVLQKGESASCTFNAFVSGNAGDKVTNTVTAKAYQESTGKDIVDSDDATVDVINLPDEIVPGVTKTAQSASCRLDVVYQVVVSNNSVVDTLTVDALKDDRFGDLTSVHDSVIATDCKTGGTIDPTATYSCNFTGRISSADCKIDHKNTVTADVTDDDGSGFTATDDAVVSVTVLGPTN